MLCEDVMFEGALRVCVEDVLGVVVVWVCWPVNLQDCLCIEKIVVCLYG